MKSDAGDVRDPRPSEPFRSDQAGEPLDFSERRQQELAQEAHTWEAILRYLSKPRRQKARHWWDPRTQVCRVCGVTEVANAAVEYGYGIPCDPQTGRDPMSESNANPDPLVAPVVGGTPELWKPYMPIDALLLPCPFCGEKAVLTDVRQSGHSFTIGCVNELCWRPRTDYYSDKDAVVELWNKRAALVPRPEPREPEWLSSMKARLARVRDLNPRAEFAYFNVNEVAALIAELDAAVRPASAPSLDYVQVLNAAKAIVNASVLYRKFIDGTPLENDIAVWMADFVFAQHEAASAPSCPLEEQEDVVLKVEVVREEDGRFCAAWEHDNAAGAGRYSATVVGALAELCASLIKLDEDEAHERLRVLVPGGDPQEP